MDFNTEDRLTENFCGDWDSIRFTFNTEIVVVFESDYSGIGNGFRATYSVDPVAGEGMDFLLNLQNCLFIRLIILHFSQRGVINRSCSNVEMYECNDITDFPLYSVVT